MVERYVGARSAEEMAMIDIDGVEIRAGKLVGVLETTQALDKHWTKAREIARALCVPAVLIRYELNMPQPTCEGCDACEGCGAPKNHPDLRIAKFDIRKFGVDGKIVWTENDLTPEEFWPWLYKLPNEEPPIGRRWVGK
jgi:hypothetical protein